GRGAAEPGVAVAVAEAVHCRGISADLRLPDGLAGRVVWLHRCGPLARLHRMGVQFDFDAPPGRGHLSVLRVHSHRAGKGAEQFLDRREDAVDAGQRDGLGPDAPNGRLAVRGRGSARLRRRPARCSAAGVFRRHPDSGPGPGPLLPDPVQAIGGGRQGLAFSPALFREHPMTAMALLGMLWVADLALAWDEAKPDAREAAAQALIEALAKEDFTAATKDFDAAVKKKVPAEKLQAVWKDLLCTAGPFRKQLGTRAEKAVKGHVVVVTCQFQLARFDFRLMFNDDNQIASFLIQPVKLAFEYKPPAYVRPDSFRDSAVVVNP